MRTPAPALATLFDLDAPPLEPRYNVAPSQPLLTVRLDREGAREWAFLKWGLVPSWAKDPGIGNSLINARGDTAHEKPSFRAAFKRRRCLVPADGFFEWQRRNKGKQPYYITLKDGSPFAIAGLWEIWTGPGGEELQTCTLITTEANEVVQPLHDRMPVILAPEDFDLWLGQPGDASKEEIAVLRHLLHPFPAKQMQAAPVSKAVNNPRNEGPECIEPVTEAGE